MTRIVAICFGFLAETVKALGDKVVELLQASGGTDESSEVYGVVPRDYGCDIAGTQAVIRILVALPLELLGKLEPGLHCKLLFTS